LRALDYRKLGSCNSPDDLSGLNDVGKFLFEKYETFFKRYDGIRTDAAWQFITPFIYQEINGIPEEYKLPEIDMTIFNIMSAAAKKVYGGNFDNKKPDNILLELVGLAADKSRELTINKYPHLYTTSYAEYNETPAQFKLKGYKDGKFYTGVGCHDNESLVDLAKDTEKRTSHTLGMVNDYDFMVSDIEYKTEDYQNLSYDEKEKEKFRNAKFAEIFISNKQFFTLTDAFGMGERINISGKESPDNWTTRIPSDYEKFYYSQAMNGYGLNLPKALSIAMDMKKINNPFLKSKLNQAAEILREKGAKTTKEADELELKGGIKNKFVYFGWI